MVAMEEYWVNGWSLEIGYRESVEELSIGSGSRERVEGVSRGSGYG